MHVYPVLPLIPEAAARAPADRGLAVVIRSLGFDGLDGRTAYDVWRLRQDVFVVEQASRLPRPRRPGPRSRPPGTWC